MIPLDKFTQKAQEAIASSQTIASDYTHQQVDTIHLLLALVRQEGGVVGSLLEKLKLDTKLLEGQIEKILEVLPQVAPFPGAFGQIYVTRNLNEVLSQSMKPPSSKTSMFPRNICSSLFSSAAGRPSDSSNNSAFRRLIYWRVSKRSGAPSVSRARSRSRPISHWRNTR